MPEENLCQASRNQSDKDARGERGERAAKGWKRADLRCRGVKGYVARVNDRLWLGMNRTGSGRELVVKTR